MGHASFAYIVDVEPHDPWALEAAVRLLQSDPPPSSRTAHTAEGDYTIADNPSVRVLPRPPHLTSARLEAIAVAMIRNLNASAQAREAPDADLFKPFAWDDAEARAFLFEHAGKWLPTIVMPIDDKRAFVFGMAGG